MINKSWHYQRLEASMTHHANQYVVMYSLRLGRHKFGEHSRQLKQRIKQLQNLSNSELPQKSREKGALIC